MSRKPRPDLIDEETPEADARWFEKARPAPDVLRSLIGDEATSELVSRGRGRPPSAAPKEHLNLRLDVDIVQAFRRTGAGWQGRINDALRDWLKQHA